MLIKVIKPYKKGRKTVPVDKEVKCAKEYGEKKIKEKLAKDITQDLEAFDKAVFKNLKEKQNGGRN